MAQPLKHPSPTLQFPLIVHENHTVHNILIVPERIKSRFKYVSILSHYNPVWQTIPYVNNKVSKTIFM